MRTRFSWIDVTLWGLVIYLSCHIPLIEMRVEDDPYKYTQQQPATTLKPEPPRVELKLGKCFHMTRDRCPTDGKCTRVDAVSIFCCDVDSLQSLKDNLALPMSQNTTNLHVLNASIAELDLSQAVFRRLVSMAITDGAIGKIVGQFPKHSSIACLNISNNNLTGASLQPSQRPFAYLFALTVLDASSNNLTEFPLSLVSNRKISVDLSGNNYLPCKHIQKVMELNSSLVTFENYNKTFCRLDLQWNWFEDVQIVPIEHVKMQTQLNVRCAMIQPPNINCSCVPDRLEVHDGAVTNLVAVDCSQRHLKELPSDLPPNTVKLNVSYNNITSLQAVASDPSYEHLRQLLVDYNDIDNIVELEGTKFIDNFMLFSISHNKLKTIHTYVFSNKFDSNDQYNTISIGGNYIYCDCNTEKVIKPWLLENLKIIGDYRALQCQENMGAVVDLIEYQVCHSPRDWTEYIYYIIALEVIILVLLISKVSYDYWVFKTAGYLPWPANKMPRLPCDWLCE